MSEGFIDPEGLARVAEIIREAVEKADAEREEAGPAEPPAKPSKAFVALREQLLRRFTDA